MLGLIFKIKNNKQLNLKTLKMFELPGYSFKGVTLMQLTNKKYGHRMTLAI